MSIFSRFCRIFFPKLALPGRAPSRGFTIVELVVVVAIVLIITGFTLLRHSRFDSTTLLRSLTYSIALSVRQAQVYGTSVRGVGNPGAITYAPGFGVQFSSGEPTRYFLFADVDGDQVRDTTPDETVTTHNLGRSFSIRNFCAVTAGGTETCSNTGALTSLTIYFRRPDPEATIITSAGGGPYAYAYIEVQSSADSGVRSIKVTSVGQIAVCGLNVAVSAC